MLSFGKMQKKEITDHPPKSNCCRRAILFGALTGRGKRTEQGISLATDSESAAFFSDVLTELSVRDLCLVPTQGGGRGLTLLFTFPAADHFLTDLESGSEFRFLPKCSTCRQNLLRGLFLSCGRISDPKKEYCLEFSCKSREKYVNMLLESFGLTFRQTTRKNEGLLVCKNSAGVEDFLSQTGLNNAVFDVMNAKIENDFLLEATRVANCETNNITRAVAASKVQIEAIEYLQRKHALSSLPAELESAAKLRLENLEMSVAQLALRCVPPITKSGLNHRLEKLVTYAKKMIETDPDEQKGVGEKGDSV